MTERAYSIWHPVLSNTIPISFIRKNELFIDDDGQMARFSQIKTANVTRHPPHISALFADASTFLNVVHYDAVAKHRNSWS